MKTEVRDMIRAPGRSILTGLSAHQRRKASTSALPPGQLLAHKRIAASDGPHRHPPPIVFLHGLLGNKRNIKTMASTLCRSTGRDGLLLDITGHGESKPVAEPDPHSVTFQRAMRDISHTLDRIVDPNGTMTPAPVLSMVGHSLGGRLALTFASTQQKPLQSVWLLDTVPGHLDASVLHTLQAAEQISQVEWNTSLDVAAALTKEPHRLSKPVATWLAAQYDTSTQSFAFSIPAALALAEDFSQHDFWTQLDTVLAATDTSVHLVQAANNAAWNQREIQAALHERANAASFHHHILPDAGHWVHIDAPKGLQSLFETGEW